MEPATRLAHPILLDEGHIYSELLCAKDNQPLAENTTTTTNFQGFSVRPLSVGPT